MSTLDLTQKLRQREQDRFEGMVELLVLTLPEHGEMRLFEGGVNHWSRDELVTWRKAARRAGRQLQRPVRTTMLEHDGEQRLFVWLDDYEVTDEDMHAVARALDAALKGDPATGKVPVQAAAQRAQISVRRFIETYGGYPTST